MKFTLTCQHNVYDDFSGLIDSDDGMKITTEFKEVQLDEVLENIEMFLRGCGFNPSGHLEFVEYE
jgi:hypothetical protein